MSERSPRTQQRVVVLGNDEDLRTVVCEVLDLAGYDASHAARDDAQLESVARAHPELVVLDLGLSDQGLTSGWSVLADLRAHPTLGMVPVLILTADVTALRERAEELATDSMVGSIAKPFMMEDLEGAASSLLGGTPIPGWDDRSDLVLIADAESNLIDASDAVLSLLGLDADQVRRKRVSEIVAGGDPWTAEEWRRYRDEGRWEGDVTLRTADGREIPATADAQVVEIDGRAWHVSRLLLTEPGPAASASA